uniref:Uncharacterized protein n=1 Tax=Panagrolaimus davidi TaxID=227884 RepID=A0A914QGB6_9BILA
MDLSNKIISHPIQTQYFPFFPTFMKYILQNSSPNLLLKFYQCCKYFYFKLKITIAENVWFYNDSKEKVIRCGLFGKNGKGFCFRDYPNIEKLWLCDKLHIDAIRGPSDNYGLIGNEFLNKIYRNTLKKLSICSGFTLFKELEILSKSPNLTEVDLQTTVKNENDEPIPVEEIMVLFPNIKKFQNLSSHFTMESFQKLSKFKFSNKINSLEFRMIETEFDPISMCKFLKDNFDDENSSFRLTFDSDHLKNQMLLQFKEIMNKWETKKPKFFHN